jgi:crotonobetainyl-CoA:carnitine CoA-transferase CaiB-like acyl-CoA transferase
MSLDGEAALAGVRVLDFTWSVVGPTMTRNLAAMGAEVIKVEWPTHPDPMRTTMYAAGEQNKTLDNGPFFNNLNVGKRSLSLNVRTPQGMDVVHRLVEKADIVAESYSSGVFRRWGLDYPELRRLNPSVVYISASGFGHSGPYENYDTWGPTAQAFNGLTSISGLPDQEPAGWGWSYMDVVGGGMATVAVLAALHHRERTGEGQHVDMSQVESGLLLNGPGLLHAVADGKNLRNEAFPPGNASVLDGETCSYGYRGEYGAPSNAYPTAGGGHNDYCVISVVADDEWRALRGELGDRGWARSPELDSAEGRIGHQATIDRHIAEWTASQDKYELMARLQAVGVRCAAVQSAEDRLENDPQLRHRELFPSLEHPILGAHRFEALPIKMSGAPSALPERWPLIGQDNDYVLQELLGLSSDDVAALARDGIMWPEELPRDVTVARSLW